MIKNQHLLAMSLAACMGLTACGGSSDSSTPSNPSSTPSNSPSNPANNIKQKVTGKFIDSAVQGIDVYVNDKKIGETDKNGEFTYFTGDIVTFKVGKVTLGRIKNPKTVTPADLTTNTSSLNNILVFLQSIDDDRNPDNGIKIKIDTKSNLVNDIDLSKRGNTLAQIKEDLKAQIALWVTVKKAQEHFKNALNNQTPNDLVQKITNQLIGYWQSNCIDGTIQLTEIKKRNSNTYYPARSVIAKYDTQNCGGNQNELKPAENIDKWHKTQGVVKLKDSYILTQQKLDYEDDLWTLMVTFKNDTIIHSSHEYHKRVKSFNIDNSLIKPITSEESQKLKTAATLVNRSVGSWKTSCLLGEDGFDPAITYLVVKKVNDTTVSMKSKTDTYYGKNCSGEKQSGTNDQTLAYAKLHHTLLPKFNGNNQMVIGKTIFNRVS